MSINIEIKDDKTSLSVVGEMTIYTAQEYLSAISDDFSADKNLELDLSGVEEIDTSGLQIIASLSKELHNHASEMKIIAVSDVAKEALDVSCLLNNLNVSKKES